MEKTPSATARAWQPGDVAMLTLRTGVEKPAVRVEPAGEEGWVWHLLGEEFPGVAESGVTAARPLVVIDPEDDEQVDRVIDALCEAMCKGDPDRDAARAYEVTAHMRAALRSLSEGVTP